MACLALAFQLSHVEGQFSFSLPGKWGNGKRTGAGHQLDCEKADPEMLFQVYKATTVGEAGASFNNVLVLDKGFARYLP